MTYPNISEGPLVDCCEELKIRQYHMSFPDKKMATFFDGGAKITMPVEYGMPKIDEQFLNSTIFLFKSVNAARSGDTYGGTGFIVGYAVRISGRSEKFIGFYAVTNKHTLHEGSTVIRLHRKDGSQRIIDTEPADWKFIADGNDVAVIPISLSQEDDQFAFIPLDLFIQNDDDFYGLGDDVFMVGRFVNHGGGKQNKPSVRFGNISMMPTVIKIPKLRGMRIECYCLDMHSRTGYSGSPVFVYRLPGGDLSTVGKMDLSRDMKFLGIHIGQFTEQIEIKGGDSFFGPSGMTMVAPAWSIMEVFEMPELKKELKQAKKELEESLRDRPLPPELESTDDSDTVETRRDETLGRMLDTPPKPRK